MFPSSKIAKKEFELLKKVIDSSGSLEAEIESGSMEPVIATGQKIKIDKLGDSELLRRFDILVVWTNETLTCHYLVHRNKALKENGEEIFVSRGLANHGEDLPVPLSHILGKVEIQIPWRLKLRETLMSKRRQRSI